MVKIRDDLDGVVFIADPEGRGALRLAAGDEVPDGVEVGDHLLAEPVDDGADSDAVNDIEEPPREGRGSGVQAWRDYAAAIGVQHPSKATREDIIELVDAAKTAGEDTNPEDVDNGDPGDDVGDPDDA